MIDKLKSYVKFLKQNRLTFLILLGIILGGFYYIYFSQSPPLLKKKVYRITYDESWYPLNLQNEEEYISIFSEELLRDISEKEHFSVEIFKVDFYDLLAGIDKGEYDGILSSVILHDENIEKYIASNPYYRLGPVLVVSAASNIKSMKDLKGKTIGLIRNSQSIRSLDKYTSTDFVFYDFEDRDKLIEDVINKKIDGMVLNMMTAHQYINDKMYQNQLKIVTAPLNDAGLRLIMRNDKECKRVIIKFNEGLNELKKNGVYNKLLEKWSLFDPENPLK
jgi:polar amino acid transport system substrate-binding protein